MKIRTLIPVAWYVIDLTSFVKAEWNAGQRVINLALHNGAKSTFGLNITSREASTNTPQLVVAY